jgi:hypothetical protein
VEKIRGMGFDAVKARTILMVRSSCRKTELFSKKKKKKKKKKNTQKKPGLDLDALVALLLDGGDEVEVIGPAPKKDVVDLTGLKKRFVVSWLVFFLYCLRNPSYGCCQC